MKKQLSFSTFGAGLARLERLGLSLEGRLKFKPLDLSKIEPFCKPWIGSLLALVFIVSRGPGWLLHPQFMIEDGRFFYADAYGMGPRSIVMQYAGYYHLLPRLVALAAAFLPIALGPFVMALGSVVTQAACAAFLLSRRMEKQLPSLGLRLLLAFLVVAYPNADEFFSNMAHAQWYLALFGTALLCAEPGMGLASEVGDYVATVLVAFTGPLSMIFAPMALWVAWRFKPSWDRRRVIVAAIFSCSAVLTVWSILHHPRVGHHAHYRFPLFMRMVSSQAFLGATGGLRFLQSRDYDPTFNYPELIYFILGAAVLFYGYRKGLAFLRGLLLTGLFIFLTSLLTDASWNLLGSPGVAERYFFQLGLAFLLGLVVTLHYSPWATVRWAVRLTAVLGVVGIIWNWEYPPPNPRFDYQRQIAGFGGLPSGTLVEIETPIDRRDQQSWVMKINKR